MRLASIAIEAMLFASSAAAPRPATGDVADAARDLPPSETESLRRVPQVFRDNRLAVAWNQRAHEIAFAEDQFLTFKGVRAFAMMHIAIHDALNAVVPVYRRYAFAGRSPTAHPIVAAAQAAHDVLVSQYPGEQGTLDADLAGWLGEVPDGPGKARGRALGRRAAAAVLAARASDGWNVQGTYTFASGPGAYQTTPPWNGFVLQPGFRFATPFGLESGDQFRPPAPPALDGAEYAEAFNETKEAGAADSATRTADQTGYAIWWMEFTDGSLNRLGRQLVAERRTSLWRAARMFALLNMSMFDGYLANWDSKYAHNHWRPYTAIREAGRDGNAATAADAVWEPLRTTPPFPEYLSAHSTVCATSFEILKRTFGDEVEFTMTTITAPPGMPTRSFARFGDAAVECADSRVRLGWHFRYSTDRGLALGRAVAQYVARHHLRLRSSHDD